MNEGAIIFQNGYNLCVICMYYVSKCSTSCIIQCSRQNDILKIADSICLMYL
nr:hypothetical protein Iba_chr13aCG0660 [Ipomoea batatas]GMD76564.1 hypothetical protein Iba_chr13bCG11410 [Ipomoea batatas]GMD77453.1 hypothetical protein Iba_chr13cCG3480 [Ipomoea batatas]GMD80653.1 hypothetical protein Iba_chr13eCG3980 [Ipomoea batatas]GMD80654.1 hypothetical protein Iba_chr13eCG3990 [Ipomoea batatas]